MGQGSLSTRVLESIGNRALKLVFAVRIEIPNPDGVLKPGLPADARIRIAPAGNAR